MEVTEGYLDLITGIRAPSSASVVLLFNSSFSRSVLCWINSSCDLKAWFSCAESAATPSDIPFTSSTKLQKRNQFNLENEVNFS